MMTYYKKIIRDKRFKYTFATVAIAAILISTILYIFHMIFG